MDEDAPFAAQQDIHSENRIAYGVIGADLHVWGDGVPLYLLADALDHASRKVKRRLWPRRMLR